MRRIVVGLARACARLRAGATVAKAAILAIALAGGFLTGFDLPARAGTISDAFQQCDGGEDEPCALQLFGRLAEAGNPAAQAYLSVLLETGEPGDANLAGSRVWLRRAAESGYAAAQLRLGRLYLEGEFGRENDPEGIVWLRRAAEQGRHDALLDVIKVYLFGIGAEKDQAEAARWIRRAAEEGSPQAQYALARIYASGGGDLPKDEAEALVWLRRAADLRYHPAMQDLLLRERTGAFPLEWKEDR